MYNIFRITHASKSIACYRQTKIIKQLKIHLHYCLRFFHRFAFLLDSSTQFDKEWVEDNFRHVFVSRKPQNFNFFYLFLEKWPKTLVISCMFCLMKRKKCSLKPRALNLMSCDSSIFYCNRFYLRFLSSLIESIRFYGTINKRTFVQPNYSPHNDRHCRSLWLKCMLKANKSTEIWVLE